MELHERLKAIGEDFFDAACAPALWPATLERMASCLNAVGCDLHLLRGEDPLANYIGGASAAVLDEYLERFIHREPRSLALRRLRQGSVVTDLEFSDRRTLATHEYYADFLPRAGMGFCLAAVPLRNATHTAYLGVHFPPGREAPERRYRDALRAVQPLLARALAAQFRLADVALGEALARDALNQVAGGVAVLDGARRLMLANAAARAALDDATVFRVQGGRIVASCAQEAPRLEQLLRSATAPAGPGGGSMLLGGGAPPRYSLLVNRAAHDLHARTGAAAVVFINDLHARRTLDPRTQLSALFHLTPAEARLAAGLLRGDTLREVAAHCAITYQSARFVLRQVFAKVGVRKQGELVAVLGAAVHREGQRRAPGGSGPQGPRPKLSGHHRGRS